MKILGLLFFTYPTPAEFSTITVNRIIELTNKARQEQGLPALKHNRILDWAAKKKAEDMLSLEQHPISDTWKGMEGVVSNGLASHIGVCNFSIKKLMELSAGATIKPEINQIEMHPFLQQNSMLEYGKKEGIHLTAYSPLGSPDRVPAMKAENEPSLLENPIIVEIAKEKGCSSAQILINWAMERGTSVIPKSVNPGRIKQNFESVDIKLSDIEMERIASLDKHYRYVNGGFWALPGSTYTVANLWDE